MTRRSRLQEYKASLRPTIDEIKFTIKRTRKSPLSIVGIAIIIFYALMAIFAPVIAPPVNENEPFTIFSDGYGPTPRPPGSTVNNPFARDKGWTVHYFGTAEGQLDIFYGCVWGTITAFQVGITVVAIGLVIGIMLGGISGYYGGVLDEILMRFTDIILAFPGLILAMALVIALPVIWTIDISLFGGASLIAIGLLILGYILKIRTMWTALLAFLGFLGYIVLYSQIIQTPLLFLQLRLTNLDKILIALALVGWPGYTRVIRGEIIRVRQEDFVEAAKAVGCSDFRILRKHIIPNSIYPVVIMASLDIGAMVLVAAALSFLGIGAPVGYADWGQMVAFARNWIWAGLENPWQYWYTFTIPGIFIFTFVLGWNLLGDAFRDILDPTLRRR